MKLRMRSGRLTGKFERLPEWTLLLGLFLTICGAKLWLIHVFGNSMPFWDEWVGEGRIIKAFLEGTLSPGMMFAPHNEHRILFTRLLVLASVWINKQWDPFLLMVLQTPIHAAAIVAFVAMAGRFVSGMGRAALACFAACLGTIPFGWENTLWGFQSQFYFMMLSGLLVIWFCWRYEPLTWRWWIGAALALASLFTMAGGVFAIVAVDVFMAARLFLERGILWRKRLAGCAILAAIAAFGVLITPRTAHDVINPSQVMVEHTAQSFRQFMFGLTGILAFPATAHWLCVIIQAPIFILTLICILQRAPLTDGRWFILVTGGACWVQAAMTAYMRAEAWDASRYRDSWCLLLMVLLVCIYFIHDALHGRGNLLFHLIAGAWLLALFAGGIHRVTDMLPAEILNKRSLAMEMENNVREYLSTKDAKYLQGKIPCRDAAVLQEILGSETIRRILPPDLITPTPILSPYKQKITGQAFVSNDSPSGMPPLDKPFFGSSGARGIATRGGIALTFKVPPGTREADLQMAGFPGEMGFDLRVRNGHGASYSVAPPLNPGYRWQTLSLELNPKYPYFTLFGKDNAAAGWFAFSLPAISTGHILSRWARRLSAGCYVFMGIGIVLMALGGFAGMKEPVQN